MNWEERIWRIAMVLGLIYLAILIGSLSRRMDCVKHELQEPPAAERSEE